MQDVYASNTQQIVAELKFDLSGRVFCVGWAGRYGSKFPEGAVTCLDKEDLPLLHHSLTALTRPLEVMNNTYMKASPNNKGLILLFQSRSLAKKVGIENKVSHGLGSSFLNLLWRKIWHVELLVVFKAAGLFPSFDLLALYSASHPNMTFSAVMVFFYLFFIELCDLRWPIRPWAYLPNTGVNTNVSNIALSHLIMVVGLSFVFWLYAN
jgi:hypothetical protein